MSLVTNGKFWISTGPRLFTCVMTLFQHSWCWTYTIYSCSLQWHSTSSHSGMGSPKQTTTTYHMVSLTLMRLIMLGLWVKTKEEVGNFVKLASMKRLFRLSQARYKESRSHWNLKILLCMMPQAC